MHYKVGGVQKGLSQKVALGNECSRSSHLKEHEISHTSDKPFSCSQQTIECSRSSHLKEHEIFHEIHMMEDLRGNPESRTISEVYMMEDLRGNPENRTISDSEMSSFPI